MNLAPQIAKQFREVYLNGTWVATTNLKAQLSDVTWEEATTKVGNLNTLAALAFHVNYYVSGILNVLKGGSLDIRDKYSFDMPPVESQEDWEKLLDKMWSDGEAFASLVEQIPDEKLGAGFVEEKYGNYYRNILAMIEHSYYHLGQVVLLKKMIREG
ncbi:MAG: DUF1572 domain-containing protein [Phaeodactylibacter sp.]|nr:DUF1572 domain-containing protein [Phaeodactylibacter sp.]